MLNRLRSSKSEQSEFFLCAPQSSRNSLCVASSTETSEDAFCPCNPRRFMGLQEDNAVIKANFSPSPEEWAQVAPGPRKFRPTREKKDVSDCFIGRSKVKRHQYSVTVEGAG